MQADSDKRFDHSQFPRQVFRKKGDIKAQSMKKELPFEVKSSYYLKTAQKYLPIVLYSLVAKQRKKKSTGDIFNSYDSSIQNGIKEAFINHNEQRKEFHSPSQIKILANTLNNYRKIIQDCYSKYTLENIKYQIIDFKKKYKVGVKFFGKEQIAEKMKDNQGEYIVIYPYEQQFVISAFSAKDIKEEQIKKDQVIEKPIQEKDQSFSKTSPKKNKKKQESIQNKKQVPSSPSKAQPKQKQIKKDKVEKIKDELINENEEIDLGEPGTDNLDATFTIIFIVAIIVSVIAVVYYSDWVTSLSKVLFDSDKQSIFVRFMENVESLFNTYAQ